MAITVIAPNNSTDVLKKQVLNDLKGRKEITNEKVRKVLYITNLKIWSRITIKSRIVFTKFEEIDWTFRMNLYSSEKDEIFKIVVINENWNVYIQSNLHPKVIISISLDSLIWNCTLIN